MSTFDPQIIWQPNPGPQTWLIECPIEEVFYGGARGGGKTESSIGDWLEHSAKYGEYAIGVFFRRTFKQLEEVVARTKQIFPQIGAKYFELPKAEWVMPGGGRLKFRYLEQDKDAEGYQGHSYTRIYVEEATNFPSPRPINLLKATLRPTGGMDIPCCMRLTGNPGGPGHHWVKKRYIDPSPGGMKVLRESFPDPVSGQPITKERIFIPSRVRDNPKVGYAYIGSLHQSAAGDDQLLKAWLDGDWDIVQGAYFECFDPRLHVIPADIWRKIPPRAQRFRALDWGSAKPFSVGWYVTADGSWGISEDVAPFPHGALIKYREWYGTNGEPNVGLKLNPETLARGILAREKLYHDPVEWGVADPSIYITNGGPSIMEVMAKEGLLWRKADNQRVPGWAEVRHRLIGSGIPDTPIVPMLYFAACCEDTIRTLPALQHDEKNREDLDTDGEDHAADELRYACMARSMVNETPRMAVQQSPTQPEVLTINELVARQSMRNKLRLVR